MGLIRFPRLQMRYTKQLLLVIQTPCKELLRFLGLVNFYKRFIPNASLLLKPGAPGRLE
jgi:hypothetical protein